MHPLEMLLKEIARQKGTDANIHVAILGGSVPGVRSFGEEIDELLKDVGKQYMPSGLILTQGELEPAQVRVSDIAAVLSRTPLECGWTKHATNCAAFSVEWVKWLISNGADIVTAFSALFEMAPEVYLGPQTDWTLCEGGTIRTVKKLMVAIVDHLLSEYHLSKEFGYVSRAGRQQLYSPAWPYTLYYKGETSKSSPILQTLADDHAARRTEYRTASFSRQPTRMDAETAETAFINLFERLVPIARNYRHDNADPRLTGGTINY